MPFEVPHSEAQKSAAARVAEEFKALEQHPGEVIVFQDFERELNGHGFELGVNEQVASLFGRSGLICRNENFTKVMELITEGKPIDILNRKYQANMCTVAGGEGFRIAMSEGFSGEDVGGVVRAVITFKGDHLTERDTLPSDAEMWKTKPRTAQVSFPARGQVTYDDVEMVSFRFPLSMYPEPMLSEEERQMLEEEGVHFIVRHYIPKNKAATH